MDKATDFNFGANVEPERKYYGFDEEVCKGLVECIKCRKLHAVSCGELSKGQENNMTLPASSSSNSSSNGSRSSRKDGLSRLSNDMLSKEPREASIQMVRAVEGNYGPQVLLKISLEGESMLWYINVGGKNADPCYKALEKKFGLQENDWVGNRILLYLEQDPVTEKLYKRVRFPESETSPRTQTQEPTSQARAPRTSR